MLQQRQRYGRVADITQALYIVAETKACKQRQEPEPGWNCRVHYPLLRMALDSSTHSDGLEVANM